MNKWRSIWNAICDPREVGYLLERERERVAFARSTLAQMKREGLVDSSFVGNPAEHIGSTMKLATRWHLTLVKGTCYGDCKAILHENCWLKPVNRHIPSWVYGTFTLKEPDDVHEICGFGHSVQQAVCKCLLNAKTAGVI